MFPLSYKKKCCNANTNGSKNPFLLIEKLQLVYNSVEAVVAYTGKEILHCFHQFLIFPNSFPHFPITYRENPFLTLIYWMDRRNLRAKKGIEARETRYTALLSFSLFLWLSGSLFAYFSWNIGWNCRLLADFGNPMFFGSFFYYFISGDKTALA